MSEAGRRGALKANAQMTPEQRARNASKAGMARHGIVSEGRPRGLTKAEQRRVSAEANAARVAEERALRGGACERCGSDDDLEWHHRDRADKLFGIGSGRTHAVSRSAMVRELAKCDLLCHPCHRVADALYVVAEAIDADPSWNADVERLLHAHPAK